MDRLGTRTRLHRELIFGLHHTHHWPASGPDFLAWQFPAGNLMSAHLASLRTMADINFDCPHCGQNLETDEILSGTGIDCPVCKKYITIPGSAIAPDLPQEPTDKSAGKSVSELSRATQLAADAVKAARTARAAQGDLDSRAILDQLAKRAAKSAKEKTITNISETNTQQDSANLGKFEYKATNLETGMTERGEISAFNLVDASNRLQKMGLEATGINQMKK